MTRSVLVLIAILGACFVTGDLRAQGDGHAPAAQSGGAHAEKGTMEMEPKELFLNQFEHLMPHEVGVAHGAEGHKPGILAFFDVNLFQLIAVGIIFLLFIMVAMQADSPRPGALVRVLRGWVHWLRDEVVYKTMGPEEGEKFAPFFIFLFFFILVMNLLGLIPKSVTSTASISVTAGLALITFSIMLVGGITRQGFGDYFKNLLPGGLPGWLVPLMAIVELIGLFVKPIALCIRLFANMLAGHLLIYSFIGMIFVFAQLFELGAITWLPAILTTAMAVFISIIESFVVLLQAYVFVFLSVMFVQDSLHPAH